MSRVVKIRGNLIIENIQLAQDAINYFNYNGIKIVGNQFIFNDYDYYDGLNKTHQILDIENKYKDLLKNYYLEVEREKKRIAEEQAKAKAAARLEELRIKEERIRAIEEERLRLEEEKRLLREEKRNRIIENAKKQGYRVKQEISADNKIKLVLQKRVY